MGWEVLGAGRGLSLRHLPTGSGWHRLRLHVEATFPGEAAGPSPAQQLLAPGSLGESVTVTCSTRLPFGRPPTRAISQHNRVPSQCLAMGERDGPLRGEGLPGTGLHLERWIRSTGEPTLGLRLRLALSLATGLAAGASSWGVNPAGAHGGWGRTSSWERGGNPLWLDF